MVKIFSQLVRRKIGIVDRVVAEMLGILCSCSVQSGAESWRLVWTFSVDWFVRDTSQWTFSLTKSLIRVWLNSKPPANQAPKPEQLDLYRRVLDQVTCVLDKVLSGGMIIPALVDCSGRIWGGFFLLPTRQLDEANLHEFPTKMTWNGSLRQSVCWTRRISGMDADVTSKWRR
jgi:hypothetical protein